MSRIVYWLIVSVFMLVYTLGCMFFAIGFIGFDNFQHSIGVFLIPLATWPLLVIAVLLLTKLEDRLYRVIFIVLMVTHYLVAAALEWEPLANGLADENSALLGHWQGQRGPMIFATCWYLAGQIAIWLAFIGRFGQRIKLK
jgi:hypothetical protein